MERINKVYYKDEKPMIRLINNFLLENNFNIGDKIKVIYCKNLIQIVKEDIGGYNEPK